MVFNSSWFAAWSFITMAVCLVGISMLVYRISSLHGFVDPISKRLKYVFFTDILIYSITLFFGFFSYISVNADDFLYPTRALFMISNIYFGFRLTAPLTDRDK